MAERETGRVEVASTLVALVSGSLGPAMNLSLSVHWAVLGCNPSAES